MGNLYISHTSALKVYRQLRCDNKTALLKTSTCKPQLFDSCLHKDVLAHQQTWKHIGCYPRDFLVRNRNYTHKSPYFQTHYSAKDLPSGSFLKLANNVYIVCPELLICQLANNLSTENLILLIMEFCGSYSLPLTNSNNIAVNISRLITVNNLLSYLRKLEKGTNGIHKTLNAARISTNHSASPQESRLYIVLCAPHKLGGYKLRGFCLNQKLTLSKKASDIACKKVIYPDLCNKDTKIVIEYDSDKFHDNALQNRKDKLRQDALACDGWDLYTFVPGQFRNLNAFDHMAKMILRRNKQDIRNRTKDFYQKQKLLIQNLF